MNLLNLLERKLQMHGIRNINLTIKVLIIMVKVEAIMMRMVIASC